MVGTADLNGLELLGQLELVAVSLSNAVVVSVTVVVAEEVFVMSAAQVGETSFEGVAAIAFAVGRLQVPKH